MEALGHTPDEEADCVNNQICTVCGERYGETNPNNHTGNNTTVGAKDATCTEDGYTGDTVCECGVTIATGTTIPAKHTIANGEAQDKTCTQDGWAAYEYCTECEYTTKVVIPAGHTYGELIAAQSAIHNSAELKGAVDAHYFCDVCDTYFTEEKIETTLEDLTHDAPTHSFADATCTAPKTCECGATDGDALDHTPGAEADCENDQTCTICDEVLVKALGHTPGDPATCETAQHCTVCSATLAEIDANAHAWDEGVVTTDPTCSAKGVKTYTCTHNEAHTKTEDVEIDANAHNWADATCTAPKTCDACGVTEGDALAHKDKNGDNVCDDCQTMLTFTITFVDYFGTATTQAVQNGAKVQFPELSSLETTCFTLAFKGWKLADSEDLVDHEAGVVATQNATYVAVYDVETAKFPPMMSVEYGSKEAGIIMYVNLFVYADKGGQIQPVVVIEDPNAESEEGKIRVVAEVYQMNSSKQTVYVYKIGLTAEDISNSDMVIKVNLGTYTKEIKNVVLGYANALGQAGILQDQSNSDIPEAVLEAQKALINDIIAYGNNVQIYFNKDTSSFPKDHVETFPTIDSTVMDAYRELYEGTDPEYTVADDAVVTDFKAAAVSFDVELGLYFFYNVELKVAGEIIKKGIIVSDNALSDEMKNDAFNGEATDAIFVGAEATTQDIYDQTQAAWMSGIDGLTINDIEDKYATIYVEYKDADGNVKCVYGTSMIYGIRRYLQKQIYEYSPVEQNGLGKTVTNQDGVENATVRYVHLLTSILQANDSALALEAAKNAAQAPAGEDSAD